MELELSAEAKDKRLNRQIAITVVVLSVFAGLCGIKDGNVVQAMEQAQAASIDQWNEYQSTRTKQHLAEDARLQLAALAPPGKAADALTGLDHDIARYKAEAPALAASAKAQSALYDRLNFHDDQFDAADAAISTAISIAAVAALAESAGLLWAAWAFGAFGLFMGLNGFLGGSFHPDLLSTLLG
ncbi:DUF4337 domain-containing protein [Novosphingobium sp. KCTC 2891]|uniref:DUF4337 domain-containing protein n=1 Tax=Novosphingobium sp. KCTC 2891 TaxID=2989730 RepID=UPI0022237F7D|nr:DUF4337 domain-containing protein [Novosphingobium sp. KCTC 2891]MCW1381989.1 DUF4337 domain-containing protein [Novosphingobium sp. KCTC 2891]